MDVENIEENGNRNLVLVRDTIERAFFNDQCFLKELNVVPGLESRTWDRLQKGHMCNKLSEREIPVALEIAVALAGFSN